MSRIYECHWCGARGSKKDATIVVSSFTGKAYCTDSKKCKARMRLNARRAQKRAKEAADG